MSGAATADHSLTRYANGWTVPELGPLVRYIGDLSGSTALQLQSPVSGKALFSACPPATRARFVPSRTSCSWSPAWRVPERPGAAL